MRPLQQTGFCILNVTRSKRILILDQVKLHGIKPKKSTLNKLLSTSSFKHAIRGQTEEQIWVELLSKIIRGQ